MRQKCSSNVLLQYIQDLHSDHRDYLVELDLQFKAKFCSASRGGPKSQRQSAGLRPHWPSKQRRGPSPSRQHHLWQEERLVDWPLMAPWPTGTWVGGLELFPWRPQAHRPRGEVVLGGVEKARLVVSTGNRVYRKITTTTFSYCIFCFGYRLAWTYYELKI